MIAGVCEEFDTFLCWYLLMPVATAHIEKAALLFSDAAFVFKYVFGCVADNGMLCRH